MSILSMICWKIIIFPPYSLSTFSPGHYTFAFYTWTYDLITSTFSTVNVLATGSVAMLYWPFEVRRGTAWGTIVDPASFQSSSAISDVTSPVKLVGRISPELSRSARFQASSAHSDSTNWNGNEAISTQFFRTTSRWAVEGAKASTETDPTQCSAC